MKKFLKRIAAKILSEEIESYDQRVKELTQDRDTLVHQCGDLNGQLNAVTQEKDRYKKRLAASVKYVLPNSVIAKILAVLPDPNEVGNKPELRIGKDYIIKGDAVTINSQQYGGWFFEVKFDRLIKISDKKINLRVILRNNQGTSQLDIAATIGHLHSGNNELTTWLWNIYESGVVAMPDQLYNVIYCASEAWNKVMHELDM